MDNIIKLSDLKGDDELYQKIINFLNFIGQRRDFGVSDVKKPNISMYTLYKRLKQLRPMVDDLIEHIERSEFWIAEG